MPANDYPKAARNNAKRALKFAAENGWGSCGTPVGKRRANQIASGATLSDNVIRRVYSFLSRHAKNADVPYSEGCGGLMYDAWGGKSMLPWAERKVNQMKEDKRADQIRSTYGAEVETRTAEVRAAADSDELIIEGYASVYETPYKVGGFTEKISRGAFDHALEHDVRLLLNHEGAPLARTTNGTLQLRTDEKGLHYRAQLVDTQAGRDLHKMIKRGDISQSSFAFTIKEESVTDEGFRSIDQVASLLDVSAVTYPASPITSVQARKFEPQQKAPKFEPKGSEKMEKRENIADLQAKRAQSYEELVALQNGIEVADRMPTEGEAETMDQLSGEIEKLDSFIEMRKKQEAAVARMAHTGAARSVSEVKEVASVNKAFSMSRAIKAVANGRPMVGAELEWSMEAEREARSNGVNMTGQIGIPMVALRADDHQAGATSGAGFVPDIVGAGIEGLRHAPILEQAGAQFIQATGNVTLPRVSTKATAQFAGGTDGTHAEVGATQVSGLDFDEVNLTPNRIGAYTTYSKQLILQGTAEVDRLINQELSQSIVAKVDAYSLAVVLSGATAASTEDVDGAKVAFDLISAVVAQHGDLSGAVFMMDPVALTHTYDASMTGTGGSALWNGNDSFAGYRAYVSPYVPGTTGASSIIFGNMRQAVTGAYFGGLDVLVDPYTNSGTAQIDLHVNRWFDVAIRQAGAVRKCITMDGTAG